MRSLFPTIKKLVTAINMKGYTVMVSRPMVYIEKIDKVCTVIELSQMMYIDDYYKKYPMKKRRKTDTRNYIKDKIMSSFKEVDVLLTLVDMWDEVKGGDKDEPKDKARGNRKEDTSGRSKAGTTEGKSKEKTAKKASKKRTSKEKAD